MWHNEKGDPQLESPPIASRTRSKRKRIAEQRAPIRGFTSDENEEFLDNPRRDSDTDMFENPEGPLTRRRILRPSRRRILRPSSPQAGPSGYVPPDNNMRPNLSSSDSD